VCDMDPRDCLCISCFLVSLDVPCNCCSDASSSRSTGRYERTVSLLPSQLRKAVYFSVTSKKSFQYMWTSCTWLCAVMACHVFYSRLCSQTTGRSKHEPTYPDTNRSLQSRSRKAIWSSVIRNQMHGTRSRAQ
jgi:hypothetical protein